MIMSYCEYGRLNRWLELNKDMLSSSSPILDISNASTKISEITNIANIETWQIRFELARQMAVALNHLHSHGPICVYGDIKSMNYLLTCRSGCDGSGSGSGNRRGSGGSTSNSNGSHSDNDNHPTNINMPMDIKMMHNLQMKLCDLVCHKFGLNHDPFLC